MYTYQKRLIYSLIELLAAYPWDTVVVCGDMGKHGLVHSVHGNLRTGEMILPVAAFPEGAEQTTRLSARLRCAAGPKCLDAFEAIGAMTTAEGRVETMLAARQETEAWGTTADKAAPLRCMLLTSTETRDEEIIIAITN